MASSTSTQLSRAKQRLGTVLKGKWTLDEVIGVGGMSSVFAATHRNGSRVAIKVLSPEYAAQPDFVARFMREGYVANKLNHPSSVLVLDDDIDEGSAFLVMELLTGYSLERYARRGGRRLRVGQVLHVADKVLDLLAVAHGHGILHRDIKPANIHVTAEGTVKVLDFGIARLAERSGDASSTQTGTALGTPSYMPPEQARGRWNLVDPRTDLWSLGATMHALLLGERPRRADTVQEEMLLAMTEPLRPLRLAVPETPESVLVFIEKATAFEMDGRFADARIMQEALRAVAVTVGASPAGAFAGTIPPPSMSALGAGPPSVSGPAVDTGGMVPPRTASERDPMTLHATEQSARHPSPRPRSRGPIMVGALAAAVTVTVGLLARTLVRQPEAVHSGTESFGHAPLAAATPTSAPPPPSAEPATPARPSPDPPTTTTTPPAASPAVADVDELDAPQGATLPPTAATAPSPAPKPAVETKTARPAEPRRPKPPKPAPGDSMFDERF